MKQKYNPTRALGIALRQLYPGAFTSYQGIVFRVTSETNDLLSGVTEDSIKTEKAEDALYEYPELAEKVFATITNGYQFLKGVNYNILQKLK